MKKMAMSALFGTLLLLVLGKVSAVSLLAIGPNDVPGTGCPWAIGYDPVNIANAEKEAMARYAPPAYAQSTKQPIFLYKAPDGSGYGAIAIGLTARNTCRYGYIFNQGTEDAASQLALNSCRLLNEQMLVPCSIATVWYY